MVREKVRPFAAQVHAELHQRQPRLQEVPLGPLLQEVASQTLPQVLHRLGRPKGQWHPPGRPPPLRQCLAGHLPHLLRQPQLKQLPRRPLESPNFSLEVRKRDPGVPAQRPQPFAPLPQPTLAERPRPPPPTRSSSQEVVRPLEQEQLGRLGGPVDLPHDPRFPSQELPRFVPVLCRLPDLCGELPQLQHDQLVAKVLLELVAVRRPLLQRVPP